MVNYSVHENASHRIIKAKSFIEQNYMNDIQLDDIAASCYLSITHLNRMFKETYQDSPHQYLMNIRLHRAQIMLRETDQPLKDIVYHVGFNCASSFVRLFKSRYGVTPGTYRKFKV